MVKTNSIILSALLLAAASNLQAETVRELATDGMVLNLGNYTQQVRVRAKALGSGDCRVEFSIQGKTVTVTAPAKDYSEWVGIGPTFLEPASVKLGVSVKCDDGAITQVKYSRQNQSQSGQSGVGPE